MKIWKAFSADISARRPYPVKIVEITEDEERNVAQCWETKDAPLIANAPRLLRIVKALVTAYKAERDGLIDLAENSAADRTFREETMEQVMVMNELLGNAENAIAAAEGGDYSKALGACKS